MPRLHTGFFLGSLITVAVIDIILEARALYIGTVLGWSQYLTAKVIKLPLHLCLFVIMLFLLHRAWSAIQHTDRSLGTPAVRPGTAVRMMFIPIFNLYWLFHAVGDFPRHFNNFIRRQDLPVRPLSQGLFASWCIVAVLGWLSVAAFAGLEHTAGSSPIVTGVASMLRVLCLYGMGISMVRSVCRGINHLHAVDAQINLAAHDQHPELPPVQFENQEPPPIQITACSLSMHKSGGNTIAHLKFQAENTSTASINSGGLAVSIPAIDAELAARSRITAWSPDSTSVHWYLPGEPVIIALDDGRFGFGKVQGLVIEAWLRSWPPEHKITMEASIEAPLDQIDLSLRSWAIVTANETEILCCDPEPAAANNNGIVRDLQNVPAYPLSIRL